MRGLWNRRHNPFGHLDVILFLAVEEPVQPGNDPDLFGPRYRQGARDYGGFNRYFLAGASHLQAAWGERDVRRGLRCGAPGLFSALLAFLQTEYDLYAYQDPGRADQLPFPLQALVAGVDHYKVTSLVTGQPIGLGRLLYRLPPAAQLPGEADTPLLGEGSLWDYLLALPRGTQPMAALDWPVLAGVLTQAGRIWSEGGRSRMIRGETVDQLPGQIWFAGVGTLLQQVAAVVSLHDDWNGPRGGGNYVSISTRLPLATELDALCRQTFVRRPDAAYRWADLREGFVGQKHWFDFFRPPFFSASDGGITTPEPC